MNIEGITFKKLTLEHLEALVSISSVTYSDAFASQNTKANLEHYLNISFNHQALKLQLVNPNSEFYFAMQHNNVLGYLKLNFDDAQTDIKDKSAVELERIYVLKEQQSKGFGKRCLDFAIKQASKRAKDYIWLGVWDKNDSAIAFYKKNGFKIFDTHPFVMGTDLQTDYLMKLSLI